MDRALWITWYNLRDEGREEYFAWLHEQHLPELLRRPGYLWAAHYASLNEGPRVPRRTSGRKNTTTDPSVPKGDRYILLIGAADANVFGDPVPSAIRAEAAAPSAQMLSMRVGERTNIMVEAARVEGPEAAAYKEDMTTAPCIQLGSFQCSPEHEENALAWYAQWRMPAMAKMPGCVRTRKLASVCGWAKHAVLYEFVSLQARNHFIATHEDGDVNREWTDEVIARLTHAPGSANVATRTWPAATL